MTFTGGAGDGGIDLRLTMASTSIIVQCKAHATAIGPGAVRDLYGTLLHDGADEAWLVSRAGFSSAASDFARGKKLRLLALGPLLDSIENAP